MVSTHKHGLIVKLLFAVCMTEHSPVYHKRCSCIHLHYLLYVCLCLYVCVCLWLSLRLNEERGEYSGEMEGGREEEKEVDKRMGGLRGERLLSSVFPALICLDSCSIGSGSEQALRLHRRERDTKCSNCLTIIP